MTKAAWPLIFCMGAIATQASSLTPEELRAQMDAQGSQIGEFQALLNDPDPSRSRAAVELMIGSGEPSLVKTAVEFGLQSAYPEIRKIAVHGFLQLRPSIIVTLKVPEDSVKGFERGFKTQTDGTILSGVATYFINVGEFNSEANCYLYTQSEDCAAQVTPDGLILSRNDWDGPTVSHLKFTEDGTLKGATKVEHVDGSFETTVVINP